jgi:preprotein translocase subunit SecA
MEHIMNLTKFFNQQNLKKYNVLINKIHSLEDKEYKDLPNEQIASKLLEVKKSNIKDKEKILHAMALAKKASSHVLGMSYYDVQLMGALALVDGCIAEMKTGEGKTLTCSAAVAANFVLGYSTHVATANEYLATRDLETLEPLYSFLGISSGSCTSQMEKSQKKVSYQSDVVYSTAQELGFDFLRDNLVHTLEEKIQPLDFTKTKAIIDEADFILIDEARTPLIISGEAPVKDLETYQLLRLISQKLNKMAKAPSESFMDLEDMPEGDFWVDEKYKTVHLSEAGYISLEKLALEHAIISISPEDNPQNHLSALYQNHNSWIIHEVLNALKAEYCYIKDKDYIIHNEEIVIIDQNTGRLSEGRSWSNGLHQAIETKENVKVNPETMTLGTISIQNFFRNYLKISGMSGTVMNSSEEFQSIYNTTTISIPTNRKMIRKDHHDKIYLSMQAKYLGIIEDIEERHNKGQPILIGTTSVAESEIISSLLTQKNISHNVLNAKNNFREAQIIAQAGQPFSVTVSTSMAGRGTDIILGGNKEALLNILNEQRLAIQERRAFFTAISEQLQLQNSENEEPDVSENEINNHYDHIDHNEIQEQINYLYDPQHISGILNQGLPFINHHLNVLEHNILKQITIVESSQKDWREQVMKVGGLFVLGSSRNESRRIDDQLRGRSGRQGDPGESTFYLSIEDPWVNIFGKNPIFQHLAKTLPPNESISSPMVTKAFAKAQASIEAHHFNARKDTFQYDSIADEGRRQFLKLRNLLLSDKNTISGLLKSTLFDIMTPLAHPEFLDFMDEKLKLNLDDQNELLKIVLKFPVKEIQFYCHNMMQERGYINMKEVKSIYFPMIEEKIEEIVDKQSPEIFDYLNSMSLRQLDKRWTDHLVFVDDGRQNVAFSSLAQKQPLQEFKKLCFSSFSSMFEEFRQQIVDDFISILQEIQNQQLQIVENIEIIPEEDSITK